MLHRTGTGCTPSIVVSQHLGRELVLFGEEDLGGLNFDVAQELNVDE